MRVLITGSNGQLGSSVKDALKKTNHIVFATTRQTMNLEDKQKVKSSILEFLPDVIIHCAAYTNVDKAETDKELCFKINVLATKWISEACAKINSKLIYISTDFVFDGFSEKPYEPHDKTNPINYYGLTKLQGEQEIRSNLNKFFIVRTSWVYGQNGNNFVTKILDLANSHKSIKVVDDQIGAPTYTEDLAFQILKFIDSKKYGTYHLANIGTTSRYQYAMKVIAIAKKENEIIPCSSSDFKQLANRPKNTSLNLDRNPDKNIKISNKWESSLKTFIQKLKKS